MFVSDREFGGFGDDRKIRARGAGFLECGLHALHVRLLIGGENEPEASLQILLRRFAESGDRGGRSALHVGRAAPEEAPVPDFRRPGIGHAGRRHDVDMARKHEGGRIRVVRPAVREKHRSAGRLSGDAEGRAAEAAEDFFDRPDHVVRGGGSGNGRHAHERLREFNGAGKNVLLSHVEGSINEEESSFKPNRRLSRLPSAERRSFFGLLSEKRRKMPARCGLPGPLDRKLRFP